MTAYNTTDEAVFKILRDDDEIQDLLGTIDVEVDARVYSGWPSEEISLTSGQPAYLIITNEGDTTIGGSMYGDSELFQVRVVALGRDTMRDLQERIKKLAIDNFCMPETQSYGAGRVHIDGGYPTSGPGEYDDASGTWIVNIRFKVESVKF